MEWCPRRKHCSSLYLTEQSLNEVLHIQYARAQSLFICWFCFSGNQEQWRQPHKECLFPRSARIQGYLWALASTGSCRVTQTFLDAACPGTAARRHRAEPSRVGSTVQRHSSASKKSQPGCSIEVCRKDVHSILTNWNILAPRAPKHSGVHTLSASNYFTG